MKFVALVILVSLSAVSRAYPTQNAGGGTFEHAPTNGETSQFTPQNVVVKIKRRSVDAKETLKHASLAIVSKSGSGYCLGQGTCDLILTNYHVTERVGSPLKINGVKVLQTYEATSPQDKDAVWEQTAQGGPVKLAPVRDIAILRMDHALKGMRGIPLSSQELRPGEIVTIYGYPRGKLNVISAAFYGETKDGLLIFKTNQENDQGLIPGISGSLVTNEKNEAVGLVNSGQNTFIGAVPVWSVAEFVKKVQPARYPEIFSYSSSDTMHRPSKSEIVPINLVAESEVLAPDMDYETGMSPSAALPEEYLTYNFDKPTPSLTSKVIRDEVRDIEPPNVQTLRRNAEALIERVNDLIAVGSQRSSGGTIPEVTMQYRLRMLSGTQTFTMDGKEMDALPCPKGNGIGIGSEWADMPSMVGNNPKLRIEQVGDLDLKEWGSVKVFRYEGTTEDKVAPIRFCTNYGFHVHTEKTIWVPVRGEVWTDEDLNILRITQELLGPASMPWLNIRLSVLYGWLEPPGEDRKLVPTNIISRAQLTRDNETYSTVCRITDYHRFTVSVVVGNQDNLK